MTDFRAALAGYFDDQAEYRAHKAEEYPEDPRNGASARALREMGDYVRALEVDDPRLVRIEPLVWRIDDTLLVGEEAGYVGSQIGFGAGVFHPVEPDRILEGFVDAIVSDWQNRDPTEFNIPDLAKQAEVD